MATFLQWVLPLLFLVIVVIASYFSPVTNLTPVIYSLFVGIVIFTLKSFLGMPDVVIEDLGKKLTFYLSGQDKICAFVRGTLVNRSTTGIGDLRYLNLRVYWSDGKYLDIPAQRGEPDIIGFRFGTHGIFPSKTLDFCCPVTNLLEDLHGKQAEIRMQVVGQTLKTYKVIIE